MQDENKPFAPFGAIFNLLQSRNVRLKTNVYFFCGIQAVNEARKSYECGQLALCLPHNKSFSYYRWAIRGLRIVLFDTGQTKAVDVLKLAHHILKAGARIVVIHSDTQPSAEVFQLPNTK